MLQKELEKKLAVAEWITEKSVKSILNTLANIVTEELQKGLDVKLPWLGTFSTSEVASRPWRNPQTWEAITIEAYTKVKFKAVPSFKNAVK